LGSTDEAINFGPSTRFEACWSELLVSVGLSSVAAKPRPVVTTSAAIATKNQIGRIITIGRAAPRSSLRSQKSRGAILARRIAILAFLFGGL
jgi:hypothetical protein